MPESNWIYQNIINKSFDEIVEMIQKDYHLLDESLPSENVGRLIIDNEKSAVLKAYPAEIHLCKPPKIFNVLKAVPFLYDLIQSLWLIGSADKNTCIIVYGGIRVGMVTCFINSFLPFKKRKILIAYMYIPKGKIRRWLTRRILLGSSITAVWSQTQVDVQAKLFNIPKKKFIYLPYKSLHSVRPPISLKIDNYIFSGGNSKRDYVTLFNAVRGIDIPVIVSVTNDKALTNLEIPDNVILVAAREPAFGRLMAASRFVVIPILPGLVRGAGEASVCDAMWHGRAVICADDISAFEYINNGITGYVTPPGDEVKLRQQIIDLWNHPEKALEMGVAAHQAVATNFTYQHFSHRVRALGYIVAVSH